MSIIVRLYDENMEPYGVKHIKGKIRTSSMPYTYDIAEGNVADHISLNKFGHNEDVGAAYEDIWSGMGIYPFPASAVMLEVASSAASDALANEGGRTIELQGLDRNWNQKTETLTMAGTTYVKSSGTFRRIHRAKIVTAGNSGSNVGKVTIRASGATALAKVEAGLGQTLMAVWTVPSGYTFYMNEWYASSAVAKAIDLGIWARDNDVSDAAFQNKQFVNFTLDTFKYNMVNPLKFTHKTDIVVRAKAAGAGGDVSGGFAGWFEL